MGQPERRKHLGEALVEVVGRADKTTRAYRAAMNAYLASGRPATVDAFADYVEELKRTKSAATANQALAAGRKAFLQAAERQGLPAKEVTMIRGALAAIRAVRLAPPEVKVITPEERVRLLKALPTRVSLIAEALYATGARVSEITGLRRQAVTVDGQMVELRLLGKGSKERIAKIPARLQARVREPRDRQGRTASAGRQANLGARLKA